MSSLLLHRRPPGWLIAPAIGVPALLGVIGAQQAKGSIAHDLNLHTNQALIRDGINGVGVSVDGRQVTVTVPAGVDPAAVRAVVAKVTGVQSVRVR